MEPPSPSHRSAPGQLLCCPECDLISRISPPAQGAWLCCPRCQHPLARHGRSDQATPALALSALLLLVLALLFPYISFETAGLRQSMTVLDAAVTLADYHHPLLALLVVTTIVILPALYLLAICWIYLGLAFPALPGAIALTRQLPRLQPWMMADVFAIAALISLVKIIGMADVHLLWSFWAYSGFALLLLITVSRLNTVTLWRWLLGPRPPAPHIRPARSARQQGLVHCLRCGHLQGQQQGKHCLRCHAQIHSRIPFSQQRVLALLITAILCAIPAHLYPIMVTTSLGSTEPATIIAGVILFWEHGDWPIALVIFIASVVVPFGKIIALGWLCQASYSKKELDMAGQMRVYRVTEWIGRWSMIDVFVVAITVALVQLGNLLSIAPGVGGVAFALVVIVTMLAAHQFDPRLIWDQQQAVINHGRAHSIGATH